jgi:uncharacterized membrane protein YbhN (UPF0104 family)
MTLSFILLVRMGLTHQVEIRDSVASLFSRNGWLVTAAVLLEGIWVFSLAHVYRASLHALGGSVNRGQSVRLSMGAFSLSRILPGGGAAGSIFAAREMVALGNPVPRTVASMLISWWVSMSTLALVVGIGTATGLPGGHVTAAHLVGPAVVLGALAVVGALVVFALRAPRLRSSLIGRLSAIGRRLGVSATERDWQEQATIHPSPGRFLPLLGWAALSWIVDAAALWVMFLGFGVTLHPAILLVGYGLANLINALPELTPGWLGVLESALAAAYASLGVPVGVAVMAVLSYRLISYWLPVAAGLGPAIGMLRAQASRTDVQEEQRHFEEAA